MRMAIGVAVVALTVVACSDEEPNGPDSADVPVNECLELTTTAATEDCLLGQVEDLEIELSQVQAALDLPEAAVAEANERWLDFRQALCELEAGQFQGGSLARVVGAECAVQLAEEYLARLRALERRLEQPG